jgi:hypothetical protein
VKTISLFEAAQRMWLTSPVTLTDACAISSLSLRVRVVTPDATATSTRSRWSGDQRTGRCSFGIWVKAPLAGSMRYAVGAPRTQATT